MSGCDLNDVEQRASITWLGVTALALAAALSVMAVWASSVDVAWLAWSALVLTAGCLWVAVSETSGWSVSARGRISTGRSTTSVARLSGLQDARVAVGERLGERRNPTTN